MTPRRPPRHASALTLIEVMISLSLSLIILLVLAAAQRVISQGISLVSAWSGENALLRAGFLLALEDADGWHSHASADAPYEKDFLREEPDATAPAADPGQNARSRRPFRPIRFSRSLSPDADGAGDFGVERLVFHATPRVPGQTELLLNPNAFLPHDPRAWYRNNLLPNEVGASAERVPRLMHGDYALMAATDMGPGHADGWGQRFGNLPAHGPDGRDRLRDHQALPRLGWEIFQYLHYRGLPEYLRHGTPWVVMDPQGALPAGSATAPTTPAAPTTRRDHPAAHGPALHDYGVMFRTTNPRDWLKWPIRLPESHDAGYSDAVHGASDWLGILGSDLRSYQWFGSIPDWASPAWSPGVHCFAAPAFPGPFVSTQSGDPSFYDGFALGYVDGMGRKGGWIQFHANTDQTNEGAQRQLSRSEDFTSSTIRIPYNLSDANRPAYRPNPALDPTVMANWRPLQDRLDLASKPRQSARMSTHILRLHEVLGGELVVHRVRVEPADGRVIELVFSHGTSTWRGARQHWRLRHALDPTQAPIGDYYE